MGLKNKQKNGALRVGRSSPQATIDHVMAGEGRHAKAAIYASWLGLTREEKGKRALIPRITVGSRDCLLCLHLGGLLVEVMS